MMRLVGLTFSAAASVAHRLVRPLRNLKDCIDFSAFTFPLKQSNREIHSFPVDERAPDERDHQREGYHAVGLGQEEKKRARASE